MRDVGFEGRAWFVVDGVRPVEVRGIVTRDEGEGEG